jgi:hypothetical protein
MSRRRKTFCVLEQGCSVGSAVTAAKRAMFETPYSDFYRLNWARSDDPDAFVHQPDIVWSEGRSLLYDRVPKDYDYYLFADDDIEFTSDHGDVSAVIRSLLEEYRPVAGTFLDVGRFRDPRRFNFLGPLDLEECRARPAFPVAGYDQQVQILSRSYARAMFPVPFHGAGMSMWYSQWICFRQLPRKQLCFSGIRVSNTRAAPHRNEGRAQYTRSTLLVALFNADVRDRSYRWNLPEIQRDNASAFRLGAGREEVTYSMARLDEIYDTSNRSFRNRSPVVRDHRRYRATLEEKLARLSVDEAEVGSRNREAIEADRARKAAGRPQGSGP